jgi:hypothetical protein
LLSSASAFQKIRGRLPPKNTFEASEILPPKCQNMVSSNY